MENIDIKHDTILSLQLCGNALLAGVACGLLEYSLLLVILAFFLAAVLFAVGGYVSGRSLGIAPSSKAYAIGGGLCACSASFAAVGGRACQGRSSAEKAGGAYSPEYLSGGVNFTIDTAFKYDLINQLFALLNMPVLQECNTTVQTEQAMPSGA